MNKVAILEKLATRSRKNEATGCIEYTGPRLPRGYGKMYIGGYVSEYTHRLAYLLHIGEIPSGMFVCHRCDNPSCINPSHLFLGTVFDNVRDRDAKGRSGPRLRGESAPTAKLNQVAIQKILARKTTVPALMREFGVSRTCIQQVRQRKTWRHINPQVGQE